ncbi:probable BRT1 protein, down-regulated by mating factor B [Fusarium mangiferae]|uniref:Probable BRT1 protein, down-regulated by mating factor B n=1 Tax=Fusarium mangiferae TaxID=192010 RepID=A0A1L7TCN5_FUSMA|nr:putative BRT1 protein, down-regulated by mating factor B [Fusarium mangiferae]CVK93375.1 probable BRT1 protein, down-regulated by mating factor B [Fusarium mangiferae]
MTLAARCIAPVLSILRPAAYIPQINIHPRTINYGCSRAFSASIRSYAAMDHVFSPKAVAQVPAIGPYTQAIKANGMVFLSGQIPADSQARLIEGTIAEKTHKMCQNAKAVLEEAGSSLDKAVRVTVYFQNMDDMKEMNEVYAEYFPHKPARSACESPKLPAGASMEMDIIALQ